MNILNQKFDSDDEDEDYIPDEGRSLSIKRVC